MGAELRHPDRVRPEVDGARPRQALAGQELDRVEGRAHLDVPPAPQPEVVGRRPADRARRRLDDELPQAARPVERRRGRQELAGDQRHDRRRAPQAPLGRDEVALDLHPPRAHLEGRGQHALGQLHAEAPASRLGAVHRHQMEPQRHDGDGAQPPLPGHQHRARPRADDLLRRQQRRGHGPRAEPARRDAERHARRSRRQAARAHERRARLPLARDRPRVLGLQPGAAGDLARAQERGPGPGDPPGAGLGDRPRQARAGLPARLRSARATPSSRATTGASRSTSRRTRCSATTTTPRTRARSSMPPAGRSAPAASAAGTACAPRSSSPTRAERPRSARSR